MYNSDSEKKYFDLSLKFLKDDINPESIEDLRNIIRFHEWKYYIKNDPVITDFDYDVLFKKLKDIEEKHPRLITPDSPTVRVSSDLISGFETVQHYTPMLSLENSYDENDLRDFDRQIKKLIATNDDIEYMVEPKYDGSTITLVYENNILIRSATRGNGIEGEEITPNAKMIMSIPLKANFSDLGIKTIEIRGECIIMKSDFAGLNQQRENDGLSLFANARNAAAGSLRMKDTGEVRKRKLTVIVYSISYCVNHDDQDITENMRTQRDSIKLLEKLGFKTPEANAISCKNISEVIKTCKAMDKNRYDLPYEIDGMVIKVNDISLQELCGSTLHHPRWALAYKFKANQAISTLEKVEFQVGKFGTITPVAKITPVNLSGVQIQSISLHNEDFILRKDLRLGDKIIVERAGEVIPYIVKSLSDLRTGEEKEIKFPKFCPINDGTDNVPLYKSEDEAAWYCPNCTCGNVNLQKMIFHVSKEAMNIEGFGEALIRKFWEMGWLKDYSDIYNLDYDKIRSLEGFQEKSTENLKNSIESAKSNPIWRLLHGLNIKNVGKKVAKMLSQRIVDIEELQTWNVEKYTEIKDIGNTVATSVMSWFADETNIEVLQKLKMYGVNMTQTEEDKPVKSIENETFKDKTILFTGTLSRINRKIAQEFAEKAGAQNISAVSKNLNILVVGENAGSKLTKAQALGSVTIMTEEEFMSKLNDLGLI